MDVYAFLKEQDVILNAKNSLFDDKIEALFTIWGTIEQISLVECDINYVLRVVDWAMLHTLNSVLVAEWNYYTDHQGERLQSVIRAAQAKLVEYSPGFNSRCDKLIYVVKVPWTHSILMNLMKTKDARIGSEEIEFFHFEQTHLISMRLKILCESRCQDLALNLVTAYMTCYYSLENASFYLNATEDQFWFMFDVHIGLLYHFRQRKVLRDMLEQLNLEEGLWLVRRFYNKKVRMMKLWKNCHKVAITATQLFLTRAVNENDQTLANFLETYIGICSTDNLIKDLCVNMEFISFIMNPAVIYACCEVLQRKREPKLKAFIVEMYIKALTADMNEIEHHKLTDDSDRVTVLTNRMASALCKLGEVFDEHVEVAKECVLTAFSVVPTEERLRTIESLARRSGFQVSHAKQDWKCPLHPPALPTDDLNWKCSRCNEWMCKPQVDVPLKVNITLNEAVNNSILGIPATLCDDLIVCISNPRYQILKWYLPWDVLHRLCIMYLKDPRATKNLVTELKYVDIDYSMFQGIKQEPLDEYAGIEKGYEKYLDGNFVPIEKPRASVRKNSGLEVSDQICQSYVEGKDYDPNSLECLKKYLTLQKPQGTRRKNAMPKIIPMYKPAPRSILKKNVLYNAPPSVIMRNVSDGKVQRKQSGSRKAAVSEKRPVKQYMGHNSGNMRMGVPRNNRSILLDRATIEECLRKK